MDEVTGRTYYYVNMDGMQMLRPYVTAQHWNSDGTKFIFGNDETKAMYEYDVENETVKFLAYAQVDSVHLNATVTPDDKIYYYNYHEGIWCMDWKTYDKKLLTDRWFSILSVRNDGNYASGYVVGNNSEKRLARVNLETGKVDELEKDFISANPASSGIGHPQINPEYPELEFFCNEGEGIYDRMWLANWNTGEMYNMFVPKKDSNKKPTELVTHEVWSMDGEKIYFVKYDGDESVAPRGLMRTDKYGRNREYINDDYNYWHCYPSGDDKWIAADTNIGQIILVDVDGDKSHYIAKFNMTSWIHPYQPHPCVNREGNMVSWQMVNDKNIIGCAFADVSDITK